MALATCTWTSKRRRLIRSGDSPAQLLCLVDEVAAAEALWADLVGHDADEGAALRLIATGLYEVWLLGRTPGQRVELHDHGRPTRRCESSKEPRRNWHAGHTGCLEPV